VEDLEELLVYGQRKASFDFQHKLLCVHFVARRIELLRLRLRRRRCAVDAVNLACLGSSAVAMSPCLQLDGSRHGIRKVLIVADKLSSDVMFAANIDRVQTVFEGSGNHGE